ncbi:MAG TPA: ABC transporter permease, partial [Ktedonobacterales bacterium]|nr:ABC transporter permease [Ktedonobacterales bacterium]
VQANLDKALVPAPPLRKGEMNLITFHPADQPTDFTNGSLWFQSNMNNAHLQLTQGRFPSPAVQKTLSPQGNVYDVEAMISPAWAEQLHVKLNDVLVFTDYADRPQQTVRLHLVGLFQPKSLSDPAWFGETDAFTNPVTGDNESLPPAPVWLAEPAFETLSVSLVLAQAPTFTWFYYLDQYAITPDNAASVAANIHILKSAFYLPNLKRPGRPTPYVYFDPHVVTALDIRIQGFLQQLFFEQTSAIVAVLPGLALLLVYLVMASAALADHYREELALMKSRGASFWQMCTLSLIEAVFLCGAALLIGPPIAALSMSFLAGLGTFGNVPSSLVTALAIPSPHVYEFAGVAAALALLALLLPSIAAMRGSLVDVKRRLARSQRQPLAWRLMPGLLLFALGVMGYLQMQQENAFFVQNIQNQKLTIDWVSALAPCLVLVGVAGLTLLLIPPVLAVLDRLGQRLPLVQATLALRQMARRPAPYTRLVLLLTLTVALSAYVTFFQDALSSSYASRAAYQAGADLRLVEGPEGVNDVNRQAAPLQDHLTLLPGVQDGMSLFRAGGIVSLNGASTQPFISVLGVDRTAFPRLAYWRSDFADQPLPDLLTHLTQSASQLDMLPALVDDRMLSDLHLSIGDHLPVELGGKLGANFVITGTFHYFPTLDTTGYALVCDLSLLETMIHPSGGATLQPNEVWLKLAPNAPRYTAAQVEQRLANNPQQASVIIQQAYDRATLEANLRNQPLELAFSKALVFDFIIAALVISAGLVLLLYLINQHRAFEFGVLRAMGLSLRQLLGALSWEQAILTGAALLMGIPLGATVVGLALPALSRGSLGEALLPPLSLSVHLPAFAGQGLFLLACLTVALVITIVIFRRLRVQEVLRLGEE